MARIPTSGAAIVAPRLPQTELEKALQELCPEAEFGPTEIEDIYFRLGSIVGRWTAEQNRLDALSIARALKAISKNVPRAIDILSAHQTGIRNTRDFEIVSQLKIALAAGGPLPQYSGNCLGGTPYPN